MKKLALIGFYEVDMKVKHLEMIRDSQDEKLRGYLHMMEDDEWVYDVQSAREIFAAFAMEVRRNTYQIDKVIDELKEVADKQLNEDNYTGAQKQIKSVNNYELAKQYAGQD